MVEHRKAPSLGAAEDGLDLRCREKGQRVVEDMPDAIEAPCIVQVATIVDDRAHLLLALYPAQLAGDSVGQETRPAEVSLQAGGGLEPARPVLSENPWRRNAAASQGCGRS